MKLAELQQFFARAVTTGSGPIAGLEAAFVGSQTLPASARLAVYNRGYYYRLLDSLSSVFTQTQRQLGDSVFERVGLRYLTAHPSEHPAVERVGRRFAEFLRELHASPDAEARAEWAAFESSVVDLAALEWARLCSLVAPEPVQLAAAKDIEPSTFPECQLQLVPSLHLLALDPRALDAFGEPALASLPANRGAVPHVGVAVFRKGHSVRHQVLPEAEYLALLAARAGERMANICEHFDTGHDAADTEHAFRVISGWFARQWVVRCDSLPSR